MYVVFSSAGGAHVDRGYHMRPFGYGAHDLYNQCNWWLDNWIHIDMMLHEFMLLSLIL
jgi:hypothetical protein